jgi:cephalosporin hydroxylase
MVDKEELKALWQGRWVENYPHEFFALIQEVKKVSPLKTIIEIGVKCCGTLRVWERLLPTNEGFFIGVDMTPLEAILSCSGKSTEPLKFRYEGGNFPDPAWDWEVCPCDFVQPDKCTDAPFDPAASDRQVHFVTGDSNSLEVHEQIAYLLGDRKADMVFHDGGHFGDIPRRDFENIVLPFLRPGGLFVLADFYCDGVDALREHLATLAPVEVVKPQRAGFALWRKPD